MIDGEGGYRPPEEKPKKPDKPTVEQVAETMRGDKDLSRLDISDLHLNGEILAGAKFIGCDARGIDLSPRAEQKDGELVEVSTDIRNTDWTDATFASAGEFSSFRGVNAENAKFGFAITLEERQKMIARIQKEEKRPPNEYECGGYFGFEGRDGNFKNTKWTNIDFGGGSGYEAFFPGANFEGAIFDNCNLREIDLTGCNLERVKFNINDASYLQGMIINKNQADAVSQGIALSDSTKQQEFETIKSALGPLRTLEIYFELTVTDEN